MRLLDDWKHILKTAWSIRLIAVAAFLSGLEVYFQIYGAPNWMPSGTFAILSAITSALAFAARLYAQPVHVKTEDQYADQ